jgi:cytochrome c peroxidase
MNLKHLGLVTALLLPAGAMAGPDPALLARLGEALFHDTSLSQPAGQGCISCHSPARAFAHPEADNITANGALLHLKGNRNVPAILYASHSPAFHYDEKEAHYVGGQFLDGRAATLEDQAKGPFLNPLEMANTSPAQVVDKVRRAPYGPLFVQTFGPGALDQVEPAYQRIAEALAAFQRQARFQPFSSKYDAWLAGKTALNAREQIGRAHV